MISKWIRNAKNKRVGYICADVVHTLDGNVYWNVDYSYCADSDEFNPETAIEIALNRTKVGAFRKKRIRGRIHPEVFEDYEYMVNRGKKYFKDIAPSPKVEVFMERMKNTDVLYHLGEFGW